MSLRQKLRRVSRSIGSRIDAIRQAPDANEPSMSPPDPNGSELSELTLPQDPPARHSESDAHGKDKGYQTKWQSYVDPPELVSTRRGGEVTTPPQHANPLNLEIQQAEVPVLPQFPAQSTGVDGWANLDEFARALAQQTGNFDSLRAVVNELVAYAEIYERVGSGRSEFKKLQAEFESLLLDLRLHYSSVVSPAASASTENLCKRAIQKELMCVRGKKNQGDTRQISEAREVADGVLACYRRILQILQRLSLNTNPAMWIIADELAASALLDPLSPPPAAQYNSTRPIQLRRGGCTPGTRVDDLARMQGWIQNGPAGSVYWLKGTTGAGKTTIAYTLSYQLAQFSRPFRWALSKVLEKEHKPYTQSLRIQFEKLIIQPIKDIGDSLPQGLVVVIDGLDECDNKGSAHRILELLINNEILPVKFFVTSRPELAIPEKEKKQGSHRVISQLVLHELDQSTVQGDIETYLRVALHRIGLAESAIMALVKRAGVLFVYAATVVRYIGHEDFSQDPHQRLQNILQMSDATGNNPYKLIDELYSLILQTALESSELDEEEKNNTRSVLHTILWAREPLTPNALAGLLELRDPERMYACLLSLRPVLHIEDSCSLIVVLHASFFDYMFDASRSKQHHCEPVGHNTILAKRCFDRLKDVKPQFNICGLESSFLSDDNVPNLNIRLKNSIPMETFYACRYWEAHLQYAKGSSDIFDRFYHFLSTNLLLWMEVMNLNKNISAGVEMLRRAEEWSTRQSCPGDLKQIAHEAWRFVAAFAGSPVSKSTPHIYVTMLSFWPQTGFTAKHFAKYLSRAVQPKGNALSRRPLSLLTNWTLPTSPHLLTWSPDGACIAFVIEGQICILDSTTGRTRLGPSNQAIISRSFNITAHTVTSIGASSDSARIVSSSSDGTIRIWDSHTGKKLLGPLKGHTKMINSIAFSSDNRLVASGSEDATLRLWDAQNGKKLLGALKGHTGSVSSVAFSPDSSCIASGSRDYTVRSWSAQTGQPLLSPFKGHADSVWSVAFSPNGTRIISGSGDRTIRVWNAQTGQLMLSPLEGHTSRVNSVAFSPDGNRIVSGADDKTVRIWDAETRNLVAGPFEGHTDSVRSVVYSPDSNRIASGSNDKSIRMWDAQMIQLKPSPLPGHIRYVLAIAFSPDGTRIASGSGDYTVQLWDAQTGHPLLSPFEGHTDWVNSVSFSADSTRIVSGSGDFTIKVWDAQTGQTILNINERPTNWAYSVAFSPNGTQIVSGSSDNTIRVWDAQTGEAILGPLKEHSQAVKSIAFSPDGTRLVSGSWDSTIRIWDTKSWKVALGPLKGHSDMVTSVAFSPDGARIVSGSEYNTVRMWDAQTGKPMLRPFKGHTSQINSVAFSPDGNLVASGSNDETIRVWDSQTGGLVLGPLKWHTSRVNSVAFSPDGTRIVSGAYDNTVVMWDIRIEDALPSSSVLASPFAWETTEDGWVVDSNDNTTLLTWVPSDLRPLLLHPRGLFAISTRGYIRLGFEDCCIGTSWAECSEPSV